MGKQAEKLDVVFKDEMAMIQDPNVKDFVRRIYDAFCPDWFWERAASITGKYHPQVSLGERGLVRHSKLVAYWASRLARSLDGSGQGDDKGSHHDILIAAALIHDIMKEGDPAKANRPERSKGQWKKLITGCHGVDLCEAIWERLLNGKLEYQWQMLLLYAVAGHMGIWTIPAQYIPSNISGGEARKVAQIFHIADYCAAQKVDEQLWNLLATCEKTDLVPMLVTVLKTMPPETVKQVMEQVKPTV